MMGIFWYRKEAVEKGNEKKGYVVGSLWCMANFFDVVERGSKIVWYGSSQKKWCLG